MTFVMSIVFIATLVSVLQFVTYKLFLVCVWIFVILKSKIFAGFSIIIVCEQHIVQLESGSEIMMF